MLQFMNTHGLGFKWVKTFHGALPNIWQLLHSFNWIFPDGRCMCCFTITGTIVCNLGSCFPRLLDECGLKRWEWEKHYESEFHNNRNLNEGHRVFRKSKNWRMTLKLKAYAILMTSEKFEKNHIFTLESENIFLEENLLQENPRNGSK